jgi:hypothetical protein
MDANEMEAHVASSLAQAIFEHAARISRRTICLLKPTSEKNRWPPMNADERG